MPYSQPCILVADIGGTHIRLALTDQQAPSNNEPVHLYHISKQRCRDFSDPAGAIREYLDQRQHPVKTICMAVAGPVNVAAGQAFLTNHNWTFHKSKFEDFFKAEVIIVNDFHAQAMAIPHLVPEDLMPLSKTSAKKNRCDMTRLIIGPGTGLGMAGLIHTDNTWRALPGEGGHADFAPGNEQDQQIVEHFKNEQNLTRVSAEDILSGRGIERLYCAHHWLQTRENDHKIDKEIIQLAQEGDPVCLKTLNHFCEILGSVAGNAALITGALGGVYLAGGLIPRFPQILKNSRFMEAFTNKSPVVKYMQDIPVYTVLAEQPGLLGASAIASQYM